MAREPLWVVTRPNKLQRHAGPAAPAAGEETKSQIVSSTRLSSHFNLRCDLGWVIEGGTCKHNQLVQQVFTRDAKIKERIMNADDLRRMSAEGQRAAELERLRRRFDEEDAKLVKLQRRKDEARKVIENLPGRLAEATKTGARKASLITLEEGEVRYRPVYKRGWFGSMQPTGSTEVESFVDYIQEIVDACARLGCRAYVAYPQYAVNRRTEDGHRPPWLEAAW